MTSFQESTERQALTYAWMYTLEFIREQLRSMKLMPHYYGALEEEWNVWLLAEEISESQCHNKRTGSMSTDMDNPNDDYVTYNRGGDS